MAGKNPQRNTANFTKASCKGNMKILHDSRQKEYREPFGAAEAGTKVSLSLYMEDEHPESVQLMLWRDEETNPQFIEMKDNGAGRFTAEIAVPDMTLQSSGIILPILTIT